jgi:hypothetical protein
MCVVLLRVFRLSVVMPSVVAPLNESERLNK